MKIRLLTVDPPMGSVGTATTHGSSLDDNVLDEEAIHVQHLQVGIALSVPKPAVT